MSALAQQASQSLTARELFYSAVEAKASAPRPRPANLPKRQPVQTVETATAAPSTQPPQSNVLPQGGRILPVAEQTAPPLGLKLTILKAVSGHMVDVSADSIFHAGDAIQLTVQTNSSGYLYIVNQGSSGAWRPLFPAPEIANGDNRVEAFRTYTLPPEHRMVFDEHTGAENLTILFSRQPVADFEELIYSLENRQAKPAMQPIDRPAPKTLVAEARLSIDDATVGRLREASSRDLVIEKVDSATPAGPTGQGETAVYVVNPAGNADSRVAADLHLVHR